MIDVFKVVAWAESKGVGFVIDPCGSYSTDEGVVWKNWGCGEFVKKMGMRVVREKTPAMDSDLTGIHAFEVMPICMDMDR